MRVLRGRADSPRADHERSLATLDAAAEGERVVRAWRPAPHLAVGPRDVRETGYDEAVAAASERGLPTVERAVGGRAVVHTGATVAFTVAMPVDDLRAGLSERYDEVLDALQRACWRLGAPVQRGEPAGAFCPGGHSLQYRGKVAGVAQRVRADAALVAGVLLVADHETAADVLDPVYAALDLPFDRDAVGSLERADARADPDAVVDAVAQALADDADAATERVDRKG